jgi:hypothetical protein
MTFQHVTGFSTFNNAWHVSQTYKIQSEATKVLIFVFCLCSSYSHYYMYKVYNITHSVMGKNSSDYLYGAFVFAEEANSHKHIYECACTNPLVGFFQCCHTVTHPTAVNTNCKNKCCQFRLWELTGRLLFDCRSECVNIHHNIHLCSGTTALKLRTCQCKMMLHTSPKVSLGLPSTMSLLLMFTSFT